MLLNLKGSEATRAGSGENWLEILGSDQLAVIPEVHYVVIGNGFRLDPDHLITRFGVVRSADG
jgi:hypothetical protein